MFGYTKWKIPPRPLSYSTATEFMTLLERAEAVWMVAAAAKSLESCRILCDPIDGSQSGSPVPGIL